jgi:hypothetical protein
VKGERDDEDEVRRLTDMEVAEVSLVDRAANKRRYLVTKRGDAMTQETEVRPDGKGGLTAAPQDVEKKNSGATLSDLAGKLLAIAEKIKSGTDPGEFASDIKAATTALGSVAEKYPSPAHKADGEPVEKGPAAEKLNEALQRLMSVANKLKAGGKPEEFASELKAIAGLVTGVASQYPAPAQKAEDAPTAPAAPTIAAPAAPAAAAPAAPSAPPAAASVEKGSKIATARLAKLKELHETLGALIKELEPEIGGEPTAGTAQKATEDPIAKALADVTKTLGEVAKKVDAHAATLDQIAKQAPASTAVPVEGTKQPVQKGSVPWPRDMTDARYDRNRAKPETTFFDRAGK